MENIDTNVRIRVNTFNRLKKIRAGVIYDSITTVIDELLQNCQRSFMVSKTKQPVIDIIAEDDKIIIRDNGKGCEDPQDIFEFETSGWDISDAFGQGGSESVFQISDFISIRSQSWKASVDVLNVLETEDMNVTVEQCEEYLDGYEILFKGQKINKNLSLLIDYITNISRYFTCDVYINGEIIEKQDLHEFNSPHKEKFDNQLYVATIGIQNGYRDSQIYYEKRKVCDIWLPGIYAIIELKRDAVNLKAPDRKSIIYDSKNTKFKSSLNDDCKLLYLTFVQNATDEDFEKYEWGIDQNLTPQDYADYLPYYDKLEYDKHRIRILAMEVPNQRTVKERDNLVTINDKESRITCIPGNDKVVPAFTTVKDEYKPKKSHKKGEFKSKLGKILNMVWCEFNRKEELQELINKAESYSIKVIYSKGNLYSKSFEYWGIPHIEKIMERTEVRYIIGRPTVIGGSQEKYYRESSRKEERLLKVLQKVEEYFGLKDVFRIADVKEHLHLEHNGETIMDTLIKTTAAPVKDRNKIYLDRASLNLGKVNISESKSSITKFDVLIVMLNIQTISNGLAKLIYNTVERTVDHYNKVEKISKEIALLLASL